MCGIKCGLSSDFLYKSQVSSKLSFSLYRILCAKHDSRSGTQPKYAYIIYILVFTVVCTIFIIAVFLWVPPEHFCDLRDRSWWWAKWEKKNTYMYVCVWSSFTFNCRQDINQVRWLPINPFTALCEKISQVQFDVPFPCQPLHSVHTTMIPPFPAYFRYTHTQLPSKQTSSWIIVASSNLPTNHPTTAFATTNTTLVPTQRARCPQSIAVFTGSAHYVR